MDLERAFFNKQKVVIFLAMVSLGVAGQAQISRNDSSPHRRGTLLVKDREVFVGQRRASGSTPARSPAISALAPNILTRGGAAFMLRVTGSNFNHSSTVLWNSSSRPTKFLSSRTLVAEISASYIENADEVPIQVINPNLDGAVSNTVSFTVLPPIAFVSRRALDGSNAANAANNIWITRGTDAVPLTNLKTSGADSSSPVWSPDGTRIAFCSARALDGSDALNVNGTVNLWVMNADGSGPHALTKLTAGAEAGSFSPSWSPDGTEIAFHSGRALDGSDAVNARLPATVNLWVVKADGSSAHPLTKLTAGIGAGSFSPSWSADGARIAFESARALDGRDAANTNRTLNVWVMNADGSQAKPLTRLRAANGVSPVWSPDGFRIAFESARALNGRDAVNTRNTSNLWVMNTDGSQLKPLTRLRAAGASSVIPVWSPDGSRIAFESARALNGRDAANTHRTFNLWVMNADGSQVKPLTRFRAAGADSGIPVWSPDGARIAFESARALNGRDAANTNGTDNLWVIKADGNKSLPLTKLTAGDAFARNPAWQQELPLPRLLYPAGLHKEPAGFISACVPGQNSDKPYFCKIR